MNFVENPARFAGVAGATSDYANDLNTRFQGYRQYGYTRGSAQGDVPKRRIARGL